MAPRPNMPINTGVSNDASTSGTTNHIPIIGASSVLYNKAKQQHQPTAGLQPLTNKLLCAASTLLTSH